jgi:hypothetical protein
MTWMHENYEVRGYTLPFTLYAARRVRIQMGLRRSHCKVLECWTLQTILQDVKLPLTNLKENLFTYKPNEESQANAWLSKYRRWRDDRTVRLGSIKKIPLPKISGRDFYYPSGGVEV